MPFLGGYVSSLEGNLFIDISLLFWWFQPHLKNMSQIGNLPQIGRMKIKNIWNHKLELAWMFFHSRLQGYLEINRDILDYLLLGWFEVFDSRLLVSTHLKKNESNWMIIPKVLKPPPRYSSGEVTNISHLLEKENHLLRCVFWEGIMLFPEGAILTSCDTILQLPWWSFQPIIRVPTGKWQAQEVVDIKWQRFTWIWIMS